MSTAAVLEGVLVVLNDARCSLNDDQTDVDDRLYLVQLVLKAELDRLTEKPAKPREEVAQVEEAPAQPQKINKARIAQLWAAGKKPKEIADAVGCSEQTVRNWAKREAK